MASDPLLEFLRSPEAYPHDAESVDEIQTHISWVFLVGPFVYKIKKPVSLGFLDFSTLEARKHFCEEEVRLNRRLCANVYEGVVPITEQNGRFELDSSDGQVVEYAVKMRRLTGGRFADDALADGHLEAADIDRVVDALTTFYWSETPTADMAAWGRTERLKISTDENFEQIEAFAGTLLSQPAFDLICAFTERFYEIEGRLLNQRRAGGRILDCHGDLHLDHVYLRDDDVCIYDGIEFNERLRTIDVACDVAFLAMDLDFHGRPDLEVYFGEQMADRLEDPSLLAVLDFYKVYRAVVRGKVEGMRSRDQGVDAAQQDESVARSKSYFQLAARYAVAGSSPLVLIVMGRVGTGKSTLARALGDVFGYEVLSSDRVRKEMAGIDLHTRGSSSEREELYAEEQTTQTYGTLLQEAVEAARVGHGTVLDATFSRRTHRDELRSTLGRAGVAHCFIEVCADDQTIRERLMRREEKPAVSDARLEDFEMLAAAYEPPDDLEDPFHLRIKSRREQATLEEALHLVLRLRYS